MTNWTDVQIALPFVVVGVAVLCIYGRQLNVMQLDEEQAQQLGVDVERVKRTVLITATLVTAAAVSVSGIIGFVGIVVPHAVRLVWGPDYRFLLPLSVVGGAIFVVLADLLVRALQMGWYTEPIPLTAVTALVGVPFFLYLLRRRRGEVLF